MKWLVICESLIVSIVSVVTSAECMMWMYRDDRQSELRDLRLRLKNIDSQQKTLMCNIDDDIYAAVKDVYDKVLDNLTRM